jgi:hypothetical protein
LSGEADLLHLPHKPDPMRSAVCPCRARDGDRWLMA